MEKIIYESDGKYSEKVNNTMFTGGSAYLVSASGGKSGGDSKKPKATIASSVKTGITGSTGASGPDSGNVAIRDYIAGKGYSGIVNWDGENVTVGGYKMTPEYIKDGTAYVNQSDAESILKKIEADSGIADRASAERAAGSKYGAMADAALGAVTGRKEFSYNPDTDPVYAAYKSQYEREAADAYRRVLNDNNTSVFGASGAVLSEAMSQRDNQLKKVTDMIPELADKAYSRYKGETDRLTDNAKLITSLADSYYERVYKAGRDAKNDVITAGAAERAERQRQTENERTDEQNRLQNEQTQLENERNRINDSYKNALNALEIEKNGIELEYYPDMLKSELLSSQLTNSGIALDNALSRGFFTFEDEKALPWLSHYRTASGYSINPRLAIAANEYEKAHAKKRGEINAILGL